jgi:trehalose 6-phosphate phosphatase
MLPLDRLDAVIFDMDGVVTETAVIHAGAWKQLFDEYLRERAGRTGEPFEPFDADRDYRRYVDGKPRSDGVRDFLASRGIRLPEGTPGDAGDAETVCGLGNRKNGYFLRRLRAGGVRPFPSTVDLVRRLRERGIRTAVISASANMGEVLRSAGALELFDATVGGRDADRLGLPGKPDPSVFLEAARRLGVEPGRAAVVEDALAGVEAGRAGGFAVVVGVDRGGHPDALRAAGADLVVSDLAELALPDGREGGVRISALPVATESREQIAALIGGREPAVFLDYDGTLTPIVERPEDALLPEATRATLERLAARHTVAVVSGRDLADVRAMVGLEGIAYAGSHGFDIVGPTGQRMQRAAEALPVLDAAEAELASLPHAVPGARVERKRFAVAVHYRQVEESRVPEVAARVERVAAAHPQLRQTGGKKVFELRPAVPWDKGRALRFLLEALGLDRQDVIAVYLGDDETDEDAFREVAGRGLGIVVRGEGDNRPTAARYSLADADQVRQLLQWLAAIGGARR